ncbi:hypothetical protein UJ101_02321 [Flavobacteriaceae bacterium UJ101]|nr:hypothetical protein UJ101_02321 [Flavobacteriaceae bacterium UJ101]
MSKIKEVKWNRVAEALEEHSFFKKYPSLEVRKQFSLQTDTELIARFSFLQEGKPIVIQGKTIVELKLALGNPLIESELVKQIIEILQEEMM